MEECCVICAEPLQFVAYGPCGHRDACAECVARLRFVMDDKRCVICQQQCPRVFATRAMGDYTETIGEAGFAALPDRVRARELWHDKKLDMFFDDHATCRKIKDLRGLQCAACVSAAGGDAEGVEQHHSLKQLKAHLRERHQLFHCGVCLEGRKVFVSQQLLYTKSQLERHMRGGAGEVDEPLGGFAGHPWCKFCRKHFYDEGQIYHHMQSAHETCHLCRRAQPDKYTYYRDYAELEAHYRSAHHACLHPECLAKKFVVFNTPNELKNHEALEHGRAMTKAERKEALRVHVDFNVGGGAGTGTSAGEGFGAGASGGRDRGGDASVNRARAAALQRAAAAVAGGDVSAAEQAQLEAVLRASAGQETRDMPRTSSMDEFPDLGGGGASRGGGIVGGGWAGRGGGGNRRGGGSGETRGNVGGAEDFPTLGGGSGAARANGPVGGRGGVPGAGRRPRRCRNFRPSRRTARREIRGHGRRSVLRGGERGFRRRRRRRRRTLRVIHSPSSVVVRGEFPVVGRFVVQRDVQRVGRRRPPDGFRIREARRFGRAKTRARVGGAAASAATHGGRFSVDARPVAREEQGRRWG